LEAIKSLSSVS